MMWGTSDVGWGWMTLGWVGMLLFWGSTIWLIVWSVSRFTGSQGGSGGATPLDIAKARYARGEISKEQFEDLKKTLQ
ncbi:MAG: SHOCT domain-containing protein [Chloroflexi bacterium]|nr:SHOCT domain-containing protein [Chloroflexota bacterium]